VKRIILTVVLGALLLVGGLTVAGVAAPPPSNPGSPGDDCSHGNSNKPCKEDPSPNGKDCEDHGRARGNEDHCLPGETTDTTDTTDTTTTTTETTTEETTTSETTTTEETTSTPDTPDAPPAVVTPVNNPPVVVTREQDSGGKVIIVKKNKKTGAVEIKRPGGKFVPAIQGQG